MEDIGKLRTRWDQYLASYVAEKSGIETQIGTIQASMKDNGSPVPDGFLSSLKSRIGRGVAGLKSQKQIWDLERRLSSSKKNVSAEAARMRDQLLDIALTLDVNANAKAELARLPVPSQDLDRLRKVVATVILDLNKAAKMQENAYQIRTDASMWEARDATVKANKSFDPLMISLMQPPPGLGHGEWTRLRVGQFVTPGLSSFASNMAGKGEWLNLDMAKSMRDAAKKLQTLDRSIGAALQSISDRRAALNQEVVAAGCSADADFRQMYDAVGRWL